MIVWPSFDFDSLFADNNIEIGTRIDDCVR